MGKPQGPRLDFLSAIKICGPKIIPKLKTNSAPATPILPTFKNTAFAIIKEAGDPQAAKLPAV